MALEEEVEVEVAAASSSELEADVAIESSRLSFDLKAPPLAIPFAAAVDGRDDSVRLLTVAAAKEKQARGRRDCVGEEEEATVLILDDADVDAADDGIRERILISAGGSLSFSQCVGA